MKVELTQYGYPGDPYADRLTEEQWGAFGNKLKATSCALKRSTARALGATPEGKIKIEIGPEVVLFRWWDDVIPETDPGDRCDLYQPRGFDSTLPDSADISVGPDDGTAPANPAGTTS